MLEILRTSQFKRDVKKAKGRGQELKRLKTIIVLLAQGRALPPRHKDHQLKGAYKDCRECHIGPDWLLIYRVEGGFLQFIRTGSHADLFE